MTYKWCIVPQCTNTSIETPEKMFVSIPKNTKIRKKWLTLARRNPIDLAPKTSAFMCEDHFNIDQDMANYRQYKMGFSQFILMVKGAMPSKFDCQVDRGRRLSTSTLSQTANSMRLKTEIHQQIHYKAATPDNSMPETTAEVRGSLQTYCEKGTSTETTSVTEEKS